ncbi:YndJ family protein [Bacillus taeanensis]|uniref:YndJ-like protein n=1 Tax=Bacillus taeanensis TaxID=273032 RepID=A0A366XRF0_9BACI|nr:YndJ family protein [Bacillus taeanensis]RBW68920.1 hypothetical protein DS031_14390 [Bacillus taeanensis]
MMVMQKTEIRNSLIGAFVWLFISMIIELTLIETLLLFAFFVTVPLTVMLTETKTRDGLLFQSYQLALTLQLPAALFASLSFIFPQGFAAGILSLPWLIFTIVTALYGLLRLLERGISSVEELTVDCGLLYLALGGAWFALYRFGGVVLDFSDTIILLTAIHFHFSALTAPIFAGMLGRMLGKKTNLYKVTTLGIIASPMLVATGITYSRVLEFCAVVLFVFCLFLYSYQTMKLRVNRFAKVLLVLSSGSLMLTMSFSFLYGLGRMLNIQFVSIPTMVLFHGIGNAVGFVFCGVFAWLFVRPQMKSHSYGIPHSKIVGRWKIGANFFERHSFHDEKRPASSGLVDDFSLYKREDFTPASFILKLFRFMSIRLIMNSMLRQDGTASFARFLAFIK